MFYLVLHRASQQQTYLKAKTILPIAKKNLSVLQIKDQSYQYIHIFSLFRCDPLCLDAYQCFKCIKVTSCILSFNFDFLNKSCSLTRTVHLQIILLSSLFKYEKHNLCTS